MATLETELKVAQKQEDILKEDAEMNALESEVEAPDQELGGVMLEDEIEDVDDANAMNNRGPQHGFQQHGFPGGGFPGGFGGGGGRRYHHYPHF